MNPNGVNIRSDEVGVTNCSTHLLNVQELAEELGMKCSWVYDHADELGGFRLGKYIRFDLARVLGRLRQGPIDPGNVKHPTPRPISTTTKPNASDQLGTNQEQTPKKH